MKLRTAARVVRWRIPSRYSNTSNGGSNFRRMGKYWKLYEPSQLMQYILHENLHRNEHYQYWIRENHRRIEKTHNIHHLSVWIPWIVYRVIWTNQVFDNSQILKEMVLRYCSVLSLYGRFETIRLTHSGFYHLPFVYSMVSHWSTQICWSKFTLMSHSLLDY